MTESFHPDRQKETKEEENSFWQKRLPFLQNFLAHMREFPMPPVNGFWALGACLLVTICLMVASGIFLAIHYTPEISKAFASIEAIERRVPSGWFLRDLHLGGATMLFAALYLHIGRGLWYGSYKAPRELVWLSGMLLLILFMATAFAGYVLPWGQMSYWGANVIAHALDVIPLIGPMLKNWVFGGDMPGNASLHRLFVLHFVLGFAILAIIAGHILCLHAVGSSNPTLDSPDPVTQTKPFAPYYSIKDSFFVCLFLLVYAVLIFFLPGWLEKTVNLIPADPLKTPDNITPEWYLAPFFAILRVVPSQLGGVFLCLCSLVCLVILPWLDRSTRHNATYRPFLREGWVLFFCSFITLTAAGLHDPSALWLWLGRTALLVYFGVLLGLVPFMSWLERQRGKQRKGSSPPHLSLFLALILLPSSFISARAEQRGETATEHGFQVFRQICSTCHGMEEAHYGDLAPLATSLPELEAWTKQRENLPDPDLNAPIASPWSTSEAAKAANGGDVPPDFSHIARMIRGGPAYIEQMLQDYRPTPPGLVLGPHDYYNPVALTHHKHFRMPPPLKAGMLTWPDGTRPSEAEMAHDVTEFLLWADDQHRTIRQWAGTGAIAYLLLLTMLVFLLKRRI